MGKDALAESGVGKLPHHGDLDHGHDLAPFDADYGKADDLVGVAIDHRLHHATRLGHLEGTGDIVHGDFRHPDLPTLLAGLGLAGADAAELRVGEHGVRHQAVLRGPIAAVEEV